MSPRPLLALLAFALPLLAVPPLAPARAGEPALPVPSTEYRPTPDLRAGPDGSFHFRNRALAAVLHRQGDPWGPLRLFPASRPGASPSRELARSAALAELEWDSAGETHRAAFVPQSARILRGHRLELKGTAAAGGVTWQVQAELWLGESSWLSWQVRVAPDGPAELRRLKAFPLEAGDAGPARVLLPGSVLHEGSAAPAGALHFTPDPYSVTVPLVSLQQGGDTVALLWSGDRDRPAAEPGVTLSCAGAGAPRPWRMGLQVPAPPPGTDPAGPGSALALNRGQSVVLEGKFLVLPDSAAPGAAVREWFRAYGPPITTGGPRGDASQRALLRRAYSATLWRPLVPGWLSSAEQDPAVAAPRVEAITALQIEAGRSAQDRSALLGLADMGLDVLRSRGPLPPALALRSSGLPAALEGSARTAEEILYHQQPDGGWARDDGGPESAAHLLRHLLPLLRHAALTGDSAAAAGALRGMDLLERRFPLPWDPDSRSFRLDVTADAATAHLLAAQVTGEPRYYRLAREWADLGLAFVHARGETERPELRHAALAAMRPLPVGALPPPAASPAEGLRLARVLRDLSRVRPEGLYDFVSEGILASAERQQVSEGPHAGLLPAAWDIRERRRVGPYLSPDGLFEVRSLLDGYDPQPGHARVRMGPDRLWIATGATIRDADTTATRLRMELRWVPGSETLTVVHGVRSAPLQVQYNTSVLRRAGAPVNRRFLRETDRPEGEGWWFDGESGSLTLRLRHDGSPDRLEIRWPDSRDRAPVDRVDPRVRPRK